MNFYLNLVLDAFSEMDCEELESLLDPDLTYQDLPLSEFLYSLDLIFYRFRSDGNTRLEVYPGKCCQLSCNPDLVRTAYRFAGNITRDYLDLRFNLEPTADLKDYRIRDIFECFLVRTDEVRYDWANKLSLPIDDFESSDGSSMINYISDEEIEEYVQQAQTAAQEIRKGVFSKAKLEDWLSKYSLTWERLTKEDSFLLTLDEGGRFSDFYLLYLLFKNLRSFYSHFENQGMQELPSLFEQWSEKKKISKITKIEKLLIDEGCHFIFEEDKKLNRLPLFYDGVKFGGKEFDQLGIFLSWFFEVQKQFVRQYYSLSEAGREEFIDSDDEDDPLFSLRLLSFHLAIRKKAQEQGELIPFGLWKAGW